MGFILALIAVLLTYIFSPFLMLYAMFTAPSIKAINRYFFKIAISVDQMGNVIGTAFFNHTVIKENGHKFGNPDETISSVLGRNYQTNTLTLFGRSMRYYLDRIEPNHCVNSIGK